MRMQSPVALACAGGGGGCHSRVQPAGLPEAPRGLAAARARAGPSQQVGSAAPSTLRRPCDLRWCLRCVLNRDSAIPWCPSMMDPPCGIAEGHSVQIRVTGATLGCCVGPPRGEGLTVQCACVCVRRDKFPLFFSQDGTPPHEATRALAQSYDEVRSCDFHCSNSPSACRLQLMRATAQCVGLADTSVGLCRAMLHACRHSSAHHACGCMKPCLTAAQLYKCRTWPGCLPSRGAVARNADPLACRAWGGAVTIWFCMRADQLPAPPGAGHSGRQARDREGRVLPHCRALPLHPRHLLRLLQVPAAHHPGGAR